MSLSSSFEEIIQRRRSNRKFDANVEVPDDVIKRSLLLSGENQSRQAKTLQIFLFGSPSKNAPNW